MKKSNKIIQSFWYGDTLSQIEQLCIKSFLAHGHEFHLYSYNNIKNIPEGCSLKDANIILPKSSIFFDSRGLITAFSNYFRFNMLYKLGGWWVDMDVICLRPFNISLDHCFSSEYYEGDIFPDVGCIKVPIKSNFAREYIRSIEFFLENENEKPVPWGTFGPRLMRSLLKLFDSSKFIMPPEQFIMPPVICAMNKEVNLDNIFRELPLKEIESGLTGYSIHLFNEMWRLRGIDKNQQFPENSVLSYLQQKYSSEKIAKL